MKKIAVIMNTNELGGAERSLVFQLKNHNPDELYFYIPRISSTRGLEVFLISSGFKNICYYDYPKSIYTISRQNIKLGLTVIKDLYNLFYSVKGFESIKNADIVYLNGNKAAFLFIAKNRALNFNGKIIWHLRDYYYSSKLTNSVWNFLIKGLKGRLHFICNSNSVKNSLLDSPWRNYPIEVIYNPVGNKMPNRDTTKKIKTIGFVSMLAPWKGLHEIVVWSKLFEEELIKLGITSIKVFGGDIYRTEGEHNDYSTQLKKLSEKFNSKLLAFEGHKEPQEIFQEIDCLIHYSLSPEPFGRVILEAFDAGIPVISTCLGGAAELVQGQVTGLRVYPHDRRGLYLSVEQLIENKIITFKLITNGIEKSEIIQKNIKFEIEKILETEKAS